MYGWDRDYGGNPPKLSNIRTSKEKVVKFVSSIIGHQKNLSPSLKSIFVANGIRYYSTFLKLLDDEPTKMYDKKAWNHPFVYKVSSKFVTNFA